MSTLIKNFFTPNQEHIDTQYSRLLVEIPNAFGENSERTVSLLKMYGDYEDRIKSAPASGKLHYHNCYPGGYLDHILNVLDCAIHVTQLYKKQGGIVDFSKSELIFVALHHDLGKLGTLDEPYYIPQTSEWHQEHKNEYFMHNPDRQYMTVIDTTWFILQSYKITMSQQEMIALKLADGMFAEENKSYLKQYGDNFYPIRSNLYRIIHMADYMASAIEQDPVRKQFTSK